MAISSYSSYERSEMEKQEKSVLKSNCKKIRGVTMESSESKPSNSKHSSTEKSSTARRNNVVPSKNEIFRGRKKVRSLAPKCAGRNEKGNVDQEKLVLASQSRKQALKNDVTREDVTREIMENYRVAGKKGWFQRVEEWLASQPGVSPSCYSSHVEQGGQQREGTSANICHNIMTKNQRMDTNQKFKQRFVLEKYQKIIGVQGKGTKRKFSCSSKDERKKQGRSKAKLEKGSKSSNEREKKRRKKEVPSSSKAARSYDMAAGENTCGRSGVQEKKKQQKRKLPDDKDRQQVKRQKIHVVMPKSKSPGWAVLKAISLIEAKGKQATAKLIHYVVAEKLNRPFISKKNVDDLLKLMVEKNIVTCEEVKGTTVYSSRVVCWRQ